MNPLADADLRPRPLKAAVVTLGLLVLLLALMGVWHSMPPEPGLGLVLLALLIGALMVLLVASLAWHLAVSVARGQVREALRESRQQAHLLAQLSPDWQWQTDAQHHLVRWQAPQGAPASSWVGITVTQGLCERFQLCDVAPGVTLQQRLDQRQPLQGLMVRDEQGRQWRLRAQVCLDGAGRFSGYIGAAEPMRPETDARQWLQALPGPAWLVSDRSAKARLLALNDGARQMMGDEPEAGWPGRAWTSCREALPDELREALDAPQNGSASQSCGSWWLCLTPLGGEGAPGPLLLSLWPQGAPDSVPAALALQAAEAARADQASFSYTVSHDLRAPLRVVEGFTRILKEDYGRLLDRIGNDHLERVLGAAARMHSMIDSLLSLSQLSAQPLRCETVDLSALAQLVMDELKRAAPQRRAEVAIQPGLVVQGDPTLLRMMLENLLGNAWKYSAKRELAQIRFECQAQGGQRVFAVTDNGAGFDMRFADRLFSVFQRLHSASDFQGTGVGLASVKRIVRRHGGEIWAEAEVGQGARFYFTLGGARF